MTWGEWAIASKPVANSAGVNMVKRQGFEDYAYLGTTKVGSAAFTVRGSNAVEIESRRMDGNSTLFQLGRPKISIGISLQHVASSSLASLFALLRSGRPVSVASWYDTSTHWMSHFGGVNARNGWGIAQVGYNASNMTTRRDLNASLTGDWTPHPYAGSNFLRWTLGGPKIVPGMIGGALLCESPRWNRAQRRIPTVASPIFSVGVGSPQTIVSTVREHPLLTQGAGGVQLLWLPFAAGSITSQYVETQVESFVQPGSAHVATIWARGSGLMHSAFYQSTTSMGSRSNMTLSDEWQPFTIPFTPTATTGKLRVAGAGLVEVAALQIELGNGGTSFMDYTIPATDPDHVRFVDSPSPAGMTIAVWFKHRNDADTKYLFSMSGGGLTNYGLSISGATVTFNWSSSSASVGTSLVDGEWSQVVVVVEGGASSSAVPTKFRLYVNGALVNSGEISYPVQIPSGTAENIVYVGSGKGAGVSVGANMPIDAFRVDERAWTAQEISDDYSMRTDAGLRDFLRQVQGRYFKADLSAAPVAGVYADALDGDLVLREIETLTESVP